MVEYSKVNVKISDTQLKKLKTSLKDETGTTLRMSLKMFAENDLPQELLLTTRQKTKLRKAFNNNISTDLKLSKAQISKIIQSGGFLGSLLIRIVIFAIVIYFHKHNLATEVDELGHGDRNLNDEIERQKTLERELIINPDEKDFNIFKEINKIHRHIIKSTKTLQIDDLSKKLLEFKQHNTIKSKCFKWIVKNILPNYKK